MVLSKSAFYLITVLAVSYASSVDYSECGKSSYSTGLIYNGEDAAHGQWPWHAPIVSRKNNYFCGSTLVSERHVLTAAHCFQTYQGAPIKPLRSFKILLGGFNITKINEWTIRNASKITIHPEWKQNSIKFDADLAIIELDQPVTFSKNIRRICLPEFSEQEFSKTGSVIGYGQMQNGQVSSVLKVIEVPTMIASDCVFEYHDYPEFMTKRMFCAGSEGRIACSGDSGGSFSTMDDSGTWTIYGIVSSTFLLNGRCNPDKPSAFTTVPIFVRWIRDNVKSTLLDTATQLNSIPSRCTEPLALGSCNEEEVRYYFDATTKKCRPFFYCHHNGNGNRFDSLQDCKHQCQSFENRRMCQEMASECRTISCQYGIARTNDSDVGCEKCRCRDPCAGHLCSNGTRCLVVESLYYQEVVYVPECREISKPGSCPTNIIQSVRKSLCNDDADCSENRKCCQYYGLSVCSLPFYPLKIEDMSFEELNPSGIKDESMTLRCRATGDPKPTITWSRYGAKVKTFTGRYVLPSNGELKIPNLKVVDAGKYMCTASNGIGKEVSIEFDLTVHQIIKGEKRYIGLWYLEMIETRLYGYVLLSNTVIDTRSYEVSSDRDDTVEAFVAEKIKTVSYLPIKVADVFPNLIDYSFKDCSVIEIRKENFKDMRNLKQLILGGNKISSFDRDVFEDLAALKVLDISRNRLKSLHEKTFENNRALEVLYANENQFEALPFYLLHNLSELKTIRLWGNNLKNLDTIFFAHNLKLKTIELYRIK